MPTEDTIKLLKECDAGTKTATASIREVLDNVKSEQLQKLLSDSLEIHVKLGDRAHELLNECGDSGKEPNPMAKIMSWVKINVKLLDSNTDRTVADLVSDGCSMGIKQVCAYMNKYPNADSRAVSLAKDIVSHEEKLVQDLRAFL